ncbi:MAG: glycosyltransferase family 2 protein [Psychrobium sp.]|nr:glycosyltransferase family 2 protein [Psychrobium sp.]
MMLLTFTLGCMWLIIYHHVGYPILLKYLTKTKQQQYVAPITNTALVSITIVIPAYNEEKYISDKIRNLAILDYPSNLLTIIIACDGCSDQTADIAKQTCDEENCSALNIKIIEFSENRGKVAIINALLPQLNSEIIAMSDVSALISIDALIMANQAFSDPEVGLVTGHYLLANPGSNGEQAYWQYQSDIKAREAQLSSIIGAHGAFYLIRRSLFLPLDNQTINDDFVIAMAVVEQGFRAIYVPTIHAIELEQSSNHLDLHRRQRIAAGNLQQLIRFKGLLMPRYRGVAFSFASGKALRVFMPFAFIGALVGSLCLSTSHPLFAIAALLQTSLYLSVALFFITKPRHPNKIWQTIYYLVSGYCANLVGCIRYMVIGTCRH